MLSDQLPLLAWIARLQARMASSSRLLADQIKQIDGCIRGRSRDGCISIRKINRLVRRIGGPNGNCKTSLARYAEMAVNEIGKVGPFEIVPIQRDNKDARCLNNRTGTVSAGPYLED